MRPPILKWLGGKREHLPYLGRVFEGSRKVLVEPFVGSAVVFLNTNFDEYILGDANRDLIELYKYAMVTPEALISEIRPVFATGFSKDAYLALREEFNGLEYNIRRAALFVYLNRFGFNGLCRYNQKGGFNVPFGNYTDPAKGPRLPENAIMGFAEKASKARVQFVHGPFEETLGLITDAPNTVVYADPPYVPLSATANFVGYTGDGFTLQSQVSLAKALRAHYERGGLSVLSNSDTEQTMAIFSHPEARHYLLRIKRSIAASTSSRVAAGEILTVLGDNFPKTSLEDSAEAMRGYVERYVKERELDGMVAWLRFGDPNIRIAKGFVLPDNLSAGKAIGWCPDVNPWSACHYFIRVTCGETVIEYI